MLNASHYHAFMVGESHAVQEMPHREVKASGKIHEVIKRERPLWLQRLAGIAEKILPKRKSKKQIVEPEGTKKGHAITTVAESGYTFINFPDGRQKVMSPDGRSRTYITSTEPAPNGRIRLRQEEIL